eukprot:1253845-Prymnesium_polylepis.2
MTPDRCDDCRSAGADYPDPSLGANGGIPPLLGCQLENNARYSQSFFAVTLNAATFLETLAPALKTVRDPSLRPSGRSNCQHPALLDDNADPSPPFRVLPVCACASLPGETLLARFLIVLGGQGRPLKDVELHQLPHAWGIV